MKVKIPHPHVKKSKILLGKAGVITTIEEESPPPPPKSPDKDPFNISNDEYYQPKSSEQTIKMSMGGGLLQHSTPVVSSKLFCLGTKSTTISLKIQSYMIFLHLIVLRGSTVHSD